MERSKPSMLLTHIGSLLINPNALRLGLILSFKVIAQTVGGGAYISAIDPRTKEA